ncbi:MAG: thiamine pyrophosphate-binding protein [Rhodanobacteraceae bacterium]
MVVGVFVHTRAEAEIIRALARGRIDMKVNEAVARTLNDLGIQTVFGLIGDANLFVVDRYVRNGGDYVAAANEAGAVLMALGYASVSGKVGVATVTCGPGLTNTLTALVEGTKSRLPVVLITGDAATEPKYYLQKVPQRELVSATGAGFEAANSLQSVSADLVYAFRRAVTERRPVVFNMPPYNFQWEDVVDYQTARLAFHQRASRAEDNQDIEDAVGLVASVKRPIVLAGHGVVKTGARDAIARLARRIDAPLMTTLRAKDLYDGDPLNLGILGISSRPEAMEIVTSVCDCIIAFGASLNFITTGNGALVRGKRVIFVNDDAVEIGKHLTADVSVLGDCGSIAERMLHWLDKAEIPSSKFATEDNVQSAIKAITRPLPQVTAQAAGNALNLHAVLEAINAMIEPERILVSAAGRHMGHSWNIFHVTEPRLFVQGHMYGAIGMALSHGIGAAKAEPGMPVVVVTGDGSFMNGDLVEFNTAARYGLDIIVVMCNDGGYGAEHVQFVDRDMDPSLALIGWPDFAPVADALGGKGLAVRQMGDLDAVHEAITKRSRKAPLLIDIKLDPDHVPRSY